jgi:hypothetical protein
MHRSPTVGASLARAVTVADLHLVDDPPFFLRNSSSSETPPDGHAARLAMYRKASLPSFRPGLGRSGTDGSSTEDFRSVIDDLTVANKKLRQKLKKYEKVYDAHLQEDKLFEVRFHGLPAHKKKELEETLRIFAADLDVAPASSHPPIPHQPAPFKAQKTASSMASRFAESGYASMSASGQNSSNAPSNQASNQGHDGDSRRMTKSQYNRQQQSIQSYLHDIPQGLLPVSQAPMSEQAKKKLVVRRLEQVFAGKHSAQGNHQQPLQQQEVAQSAAMADREAKEATGQRLKSEGHREARMLCATASENEANGPGPDESLQKLRPQLSISEQDFAGSGSPDQRPTRPLDLDPYRAQVSIENMEYIRHLGFTPPNMSTGEAPEDGHGWLYLNLLINMAQLHTLNVTPDFVKDAVAEYSAKFELSADGRRIRWKGGQDVTSSSGGSSEHLSGNSAHESVAGGNERLSPNDTLAQRQQQQNKFAYTPMFFHREESDEDNGYLDMTSSSISPYPQQAGDSSGFGSSAVQSLESQRKRNDGPMIFYKKAKFCTDLSGDGNGHINYIPEDYKLITTQPLGAGSAPSSTQSGTFELKERRRRLDEMDMVIDAEDGSSPLSGEDMLHFSPGALRNDSSTDDSNVIEFEASGLGGVQPDDNFAVSVRRSQLQTSAAGQGPRNKHQTYSKRISEALAQRGQVAERSSAPKQHPVIREEILSATRKTLPSSYLPHPSFLPFDSTSSGDVDSDLDDDGVSSAPSDDDSSESNPATALQLLNISSNLHDGSMNMDEAYSESESFEEEELEDDESDDGSIDFLAAARKADPKTVHAFEREYDAAVAERLAEEIPAGSSAATAGGGSGFNSPQSEDGAAVSVDASKANGQSITSGSMSSRTRNLKRSRTRESLPMAAQGSKGPKSQKTE